MASTQKFPKGLKHSFWNALDAAVYPVIYLSCMPMLVEGLGVEAFGFWIVLNTIIITLQLFNLNIGLTTTRYISFAAAKESFTQTNRLINALFQIAVGLALFVCLLGIVVSMIPGLHELLQLGLAPVKNIGVCMALSFVIAGLKFLDLYFNSLLKAAEQFRLSSILNTLSRTSVLLLNVALALNHCTVTELLWSNLAFIVGYLFVQLYFVKRAFPGLQFSSRLEIRWYKMLLKFSVFPWLQFLIVVIAFQTDRFWVSAFAGLSEVSAYGLIATIFNHVHMIFTAMAAWTLPRIAAMTAKGTDSAETYYRIRNTLLAFTLVSLPGFYFLSPFILKLWLGATFYQSLAGYVQAFTAFELLFIHSIMPFLYLNAIGREKQAAGAALLYSSCSYILMLIGLLVLGHPIYMLLGMTAAMAISMPFVNKMTEARLNNKTPGFLHFFRDMLPFYFAVAAVLISIDWLKAVFLALSLIAFYSLYRPTFTTKIWKQPVKIRQ